MSIKTQKKQIIKPISEEDIEDMLEESEQSIRQGKVFSHSQLKKGVRIWRKK